ncbi:MAG: hypothetical protein ACREXI_09705 [Caldimonas sp.]
MTVSGRRGAHREGDHPDESAIRRKRDPARSPAQADLDPFVQPRVVRQAFSHVQAALQIPARIEPAGAGPMFARRRMFASLGDQAGSGRVVPLRADAGA